MARIKPSPRRTPTGTVAAHNGEATHMNRLPLFWRVVFANALVFAVGTTALAISPATVSFPLAPTEAIVLVAGLSVMLVANAVLLRVTFKPLDELIAHMRKLDLLRPDERLAVSGSSEVAAVLASFNEMLDRLENERRASSRRALMAQESERQRIAAELHDEIGQSLTAMILQLKRAAEAAPADLKEDLRELQETARASLDDVRHMARRLRPGVLDDLGLIRAVTALTTGFSEQAGLPISRQVARTLPPLTREAELVLYRVAQESLTNVVRHSGASKATVALQPKSDGVILRVSDDGRGIDGALDGDGIRGMRERALLVGGSLRIESGRNGGVEVVLEIPTAAGESG